jgi:uncharacterized damage-inducible protein DinB
MDAHVVEQNLFVLRQGLELVRRLDRTTFEARDPVAKASPGAHLRHCLDAYRCFLRDRRSGRVDYDCRERDPAVETDPTVAAGRIAEVIANLPELAAELERQLIVRSDCDLEDELGWTPSTVARELRYLFSHTVHHFAILAIILRLRGVEPGDDFGVAPSTLTFRRSVAEAG